VKYLVSHYKKKKSTIKKRLKDFKGLHKAGDRDIFRELCFCILTPQSKAVNCDKAIKELKRTNLLFTGSGEDISPVLKGRARFHNKKAGYLVTARNTFKKGNRLDIKSKLNAKDTSGTREWLVRNIKGLGYKEASHFLRNIGLGKGISILDVHILRNLKKLGVIKEIPASINKKNYKNIENKMRKFAGKVNIPLEELDLLFWSEETGFVFK
jgi:N-glycosylase/DNA lyase